MYMIAFMLVTSLGPVEYHESERKELAEALRVVCIEFELIDKRFASSRFKSYCLTREINEMRQRYKLLKDAPPLSDVVLIPCFDYQVINFNREYLDYLQNAKLSSVKKSWFNAAIRETEELHDIYIHAFQAKNKNRSVYHRRMCLKYLRNKLGHEAFYHGRLPPAVPLWRFSFK